MWFGYHLLSPLLINNALSWMGFRSGKGHVGTGLCDPLFWHCHAKCALKRSWDRGQSTGEAEQGTVVHSPFPVREVSSDEKQEAVPRATSVYPVELLAAGCCRG